MAERVTYIPPIEELKQIIHKAKENVIKDADNLGMNLSEEHCKEVLKNVSSLQYNRNKFGHRST